MLKRSFSIRWLAILPLIFLVGCSSRPVLDKPDGRPSSFVYGHIDMADAPCKLGWVTMKRLKPKNKTPYYSFWIDDGTFFRINIPNGAYKFTEFGGSSGWKNAVYTFSFPDQGQGKMDRRITREGRYFLGSYKYKKVKTGFWKQGKYDLIKTKGPSEKEILQKILPYAKHPHWIKVINRRLAQLK